MNAPGGERPGLGGWLRRLGLQGGEAPPRGWRRHLVAQVADESDLTAYRAGPRATAGATLATLAAQFASVRVVAGSNGCRFGLDLQTGGPAVAGVVTGWRTYANTVDADAVAPLSNAVAPADRNVPVYPTDWALIPAGVASPTAMAFGTRIQIGFTVANFVASAVMPTYVQRDTATAANGQFWIPFSGTRAGAALWLAPNNVFQWGSGTVNLPWYISAYLEEPGSAP